MNEQNYENNYETVETTVEFEPMIVEEANSDRNDLMVGIGIGAVAAIAIEHLFIPAGKWAYRKIKGLRTPKIHVIEVDKDVVVDEDDIED